MPEETSSIISTPEEESNDVTEDVREPESDSTNQKAEEIVQKQIEEGDVGVVKNLWGLTLKAGGVLTHWNLHTKSGIFYDELNPFLKKYFKVVRKTPGRANLYAPDTEKWRLPKPLTSKPDSKKTDSKKLVPFCEDMFTSLVPKEKDEKNPDEID